MALLCGKGIWLAHSYDLQRGAEIATAVRGTHLLVKVGHGPYYFPETTRQMVKRVRTLGFDPLAWVQLTPQAPRAAQKAVVESLSRGYNGAVLFLDGPGIRGAAMRALAQALNNVEIPRKRLMLATPPISRFQDTEAIEAIAPLCQGGWMPLCISERGQSAEEVIDREVYHALGDLSLMWGATPDVYPVLFPQPRAEGQPFLPETFIDWVDNVARHGVDFFSVYHATIAVKALWPMLKAVNIPCLETAGRTPAEEPPEDASVLPQPVYITAKTSDTVWGIITRHGLKKEQFWAWNAHLWDSRGLPRDPDYLQEGWRIRVK